MSGVVVDASAAIAILFSEPAFEAVATALDDAEDRLMSAATLVELSIVLGATLGAAAGDLTDRLVREGGIDVVAFDRIQADRAVEGWRRYGKGRHRAALDLGDCFTYGLAIEAGYPILCVGDDFRHTDAPVVDLGVT